MLWASILAPILMLTACTRHQAEMSDEQRVRALGHKISVGANFDQEILAGVDLSGYLFGGYTPMDWILRLRPAKVGLAISKGHFDPNLQDGRGELPLFVAAMYCDQMTLESLISRGADVNDRCSDGQTALFGAVIGGTANLEWLLKHGANPDAQDRNGETALFYALVPGEFSGGSPRHPSVASDYISWTQRLTKAKGIEAIAPVKGDLVHKRAVYNIATLQSQIEAANLLLDYGANPMVRNKSGRTVLGELRSRQQSGEAISPEVIAYARSLEQAKAGARHKGRQ